MSLNLKKLETLAESRRSQSSAEPSSMEAQAPGRIEELSSILSVLSPDVGRGDGSLIGPDGGPVEDYWFGVILAASREYGAAAKEVLRSWSQCSCRYDEVGFERAWKESLKPHERPVSIRSLKNLALAHGWKGLPKVNRYQLLDRDAIMAIPPIRWRIKGIFPETGIAAIYGPSGSGKSFVALDASIQVAFGEPWFGLRTKKCSVTFVMLEGEAGLSNRLKAWEQHHGRQIPQGFYAITRPFSFGEEDDIHDLAEAIPKDGIVIIDTLNRAAPGRDENSSKDMGEIIAGMKKLQELVGGLVVVVHHTGKDASKGLRGHSSLHAALDGAIEVKRTAEGRSWSAAKVKDGSDDREEFFKLTQVILGRDEDDFITSCVAEPTEAVRGPRVPSGKNQKLAWSVICSETATHLCYEEIVSKVANRFSDVASNRRKRYAKDVLKALAEAGFIKIEDGKVTREFS